MGKIVICRIGSLEKRQNNGNLCGRVICRIGSLEKYAFLKRRSPVVICRIGSLESRGCSLMP